jgi:hypothetical protein
MRVVQRRRSRINEKMKALQTLIPNSSKVGSPPFLSYCLILAVYAFPLEL